MSKRILTFTLLAFIALGIGTSCKYEEGPFMSLRTKKNRLANTWQADEVYDKNGNKVDSTSNDATHTFEKEGTYRIKSGSSGLSISGEWEWADDKEAVKITYSITIFNSTQTTTQKWKILRLKNDELWVEQEDGTEVHYKPA